MVRMEAEGTKLRVLKTLFLAVMFCAAAIALCAPARAQEDIVGKARSIALSGKQHRPEALGILQQHLASDPDDTDARVLYGIILSWEGQYDDARNQLAQVLAKRPDHGDALPAMINVELWSDHPERAEQLAREALGRQPSSAQLMIAQARALRNMGRRSDALKVLDQALVLAPGDEEAKRLHRSISETAGNWSANVSHSYDWYSDGRSPLHQTSMSLRAPTKAGSIIGSVNRADQYSLTSYQTEVEFYPHLRSGTYGYLEFGHSADGDLYPTYRFAGDLFQSVGHGVELSGGYRHLQFSGGVNIFTGAVAKYYGDWLFTGRGYFTPDEAGTSKTGSVTVRRMFGGEGQHDYLNFGFSYGASPALATTLAEIQSLDSSRFSVGYDKVIHGKWAIAGSAGVAQQQRIGLDRLWRYSVQGSMYYRF
jgi:YaiO family outer membrane protein